MTTTDARASVGGSGLSPAARTSARARLSAMEMSDEFDSLTELFLGEVCAPHAQARAESTAAAGTVSHAATPPAPDTHPGPAWPPKHTGAARQPGESASAADSAPIIEVLVIGHVPVLAAAWASQYVREVVRASGRPAAFLRVHDDHTSVVVVFPVESHAVPPEQASSLDDALRDIAALTTRWIIQTDAVGEAQLAADPCISLITLLTGADEAARVAGYGAVKRLSEHLPPVSASGESPAAHIRVATVGVAPEVAGSAGQRIVEAVRHFLGRDAQQAACSPKIRASRAASMVFSGPSDIDARELVQRISRHETPETPLHAMREESFRSEVEPVIEIRPEVTESHVDESHVVASHEAVNPADTRPALPVMQPVAHSSAPTPPEPLMTPPSKADDESADLPVDITPTPPTPPAPTPQPPAPGPRGRSTSSDASRNQRTPDLPDADDNSLCGNIEGLVRLRAACPIAAGVELALDGDGQLHVIADGRGGEWRVNGAVADAMVASAWLQSHVELVAPLAASLRGARHTTLHVMVDQPRQARRLLDSGVKFHLLAEVHVGESAVLFCSDLN